MKDVEMKGFDKFMQKRKERNGICESSKRRQPNCVKRSGISDSLKYLLLSPCLRHLLEQSTTVFDCNASSRIRAKMGHNPIYSEGQGKREVDSYSFVKCCCDFYSAFVFTVKLEMKVGEQLQRLEQQKGYCCPIYYSTHVHGFTLLYLNLSPYLPPCK